MSKVGKIGLSIVLGTMLFSSAYGNPTEDKKSESGRGWLMYENDPISKEDKKQLDKMSEKDVLFEILKENKKQTKIQERMLEILEVTNDLPRMVTVNGKECLSNSSADCFVMPIIGDAARLPVMKKWMEEPSVENALAYYKWQEKYLNHVINGGYALEFASSRTMPNYAGIGRETSEGFQVGQQKEVFEKMIIQKHAKDLRVDILLGKDFGFDGDFIGQIMKTFADLQEIGIHTRLVFKDQASINDFGEFMRKAPNRFFSKRWLELKKEDKVINAKVFNDNKIEAYMTPMYIVNYKNDKTKKQYNEVVGAGRERAKDVIEKIKRSLILFEVVKPGDFNMINAEPVSVENLKGRLKQRVDSTEEEKRITKEYEELLNRKGVQ